MGKVGITRGFKCCCLWKMESLVGTENSIYSFKVEKMRLIFYKTKKEVFNRERTTRQPLNTLWFTIRLSAL